MHLVEPHQCKIDKVYPSECMLASFAFLVMIILLSNLSIKRAINFLKPTVPDCEFLKKAADFPELISFTLKIRSYTCLIFYESLNFFAPISKRPVNKTFEEISRIPEAVYQTIGNKPKPWTG